MLLAAPVSATVASTSMPRELLKVSANAGCFRENRLAIDVMVVPNS